MTKQPTAFELLGLKAFETNDYADGEGFEAVSHEVWTFAIVDELKTFGLSEQQAGGIITNLCKKGWAHIGTYDEPNDVIWLTQEGAEVLVQFG